MIKVVAVVQARMGSTRLPGKVMSLLDHHPVLEWVVRACEAAPGVSETWVATSTLDADNVIADWCDDNGIFVWRGPEADVLTRFVGCANASEADVILRITGDCPLIDPQVIGAVVRLQKQTGAPFVTNVSPRTYADGEDVQAFTRGVLMAADREAKRQIDRDCVCTWMERNRSRFPAETVINPIPGLQNERWVLDTKEDFDFIKEIIARWPWDKGPPSQFDILGILDKEPELRKINAHHPCNERYYDALAEEPIYGRKYKRSQAQFEKARKVIPLAAQTFSKSYLMYPQPSPLYVSHGDGGVIWDVDGNEYVDLVSALLPNILGYRDYEVDAAVRRQLNCGASFSLSTEIETELAEMLCRLIPCAEAVRYGKGGTDVTTAAIRIARAYTGRDKILICGGYHGWGSWSIDKVTGVTVAEQADTHRIKFGQDLPLWGEDYAAAIVEPETDPDYLSYLRDWCTTYGVVLIFDEVITGFRFSLGGAQGFWDITPDLATFGKAMANGMPLSAVVGRADIMKKFEPPGNVFYSGTMFGEALSLAASLATIKKLERDAILPKIWKTGGELASEVQKRIVKSGLEDYISLSGADVFKRIKFSSDDIAALWRREMVNSGVLITASHNLCAAHGPTEIKRVLKAYDHSLSVLKDAIMRDDVATRLNGATVAKMVRPSGINEMLKNG